ncbi:unnamed protein product [Agarophyton chilense]
MQAPPLFEFLPGARRGSADSEQSFETAASSRRSFRTHPHPDPVLMARLKALNFSSAPKRTPTNHPNLNSPVYPLSPCSPSLPRRFSSCHASTTSTAEKPTAPAPSKASMHHLPPLSPLSSMYDPNSTSASGSEEDASSSTSSDSAPASLVHTRSMCDHRLRPSLLHRQAINAPAPASPVHNPHPQAPFRKALSQRHPASADLPAALRHRFSLDHASIAAAPPVTPLRNPYDSFSSNFDIPRGKVQHLPSKPRPSTPSRLPRSKVFIRQNSTRSSVVDAAAVRHVPAAPGHHPVEPQLVPRHVPLTPSQHFAMACEQQQRQLQLQHSEHNNSLLPVGQFSAQITNVAEDQMYFSDEDEFDSQLLDTAKSPLAHNSPSDALSTKVRRAVSALRSISFQSNQVEDFDTAWGQTLSVSQEKQNPSLASVASAKWRRARNKPVNRATRKQFECYSENDAGSERSSSSNVSQVRDRSMNAPNNIRGFAAMRMRANFGGPHKRSLWAGSRRDRQQPHAVAAQLLVSGGGQGFLAASTELAEQRQALATVAPADAMDGRNSMQKGPVDKYVEFIHASAQRETKGRFGPRNFPSRVLRLFRRKWN